MEHINLQVKLDGVYAETYRRFAANNPECKTHRDTMSAILRTLPEYQSCMQTRSLVSALDKAHLEAIDNALHGKEETLAPWSHKEEVRQIQAYNELNKDEYGDIIYD